MKERIRTFRYDRKRTKRRILNFVARLAEKFSLKPEEAKFIKKAFYSKDNIQDAIHGIFGPEYVRVLRKRGLRPLSAERVARLTRELHIDLLVYESKDRKCRVIIEMCNKNDFPALSIECWIKKRLRLPGGFITVSANNPQLVRAIFLDIDEFLN